VESVEALESAAREEALPWVRAALHDEHPAVRFAACLAAGNARDNLAEGAIRRCASDENASVRVAALYALHRLGKTDQSGKLATYLLKDKDPSARRNAALVLGMLGESGAVPILARAVKDDQEPGVRQHALEALALLGNNEAKQELVFRTNSGVGSEEVMALNALIVTRDPKFADTYKYKLATAAHVETRLAAARGLGLLGDDTGGRYALDALKLDHPPVTDANDSAEGQLLRVRQLACAALGAVRRPDSLPALAREMESNPDPRVQIAAARAILDVLRARGSRSFATAAALEASGKKP
jgi:HEAT repeat protein